jgi:hypothetical protein
MIYYTHDRATYDRNFDGPHHVCVDAHSEDSGEGKQNKNILG